MVNQIVVAFTTPAQTQEGDFHPACLGKEVLVYIWRIEHGNKAWWKVAPTWNYNKAALTTPKFPLPSLLPFNPHYTRDL